MLRKRLGFALVSVIALSLGPASGVGSAAGTSPLEASWGRVPLRFEANEGQLDPRVLFVSRGPGYNLSLTREGASLLFSERAGSLAVDLRLVGGSAAPRVAGESPEAAPVHYFVGSDPGRWRRGVQAYKSVRYDAVYPGIDLVFHGRQGSLEYDFVVAPGADPGVIELDFRGADTLAVDAEGSLVVSAGDRSLVQPRPVVYQDGPDGRREVAGGYVLREDRVRFTVADYDRSLPLVIDPVFTYASYYGGGGFDELFGIARDAQGNVWATGVTASANLPVSTGALDGAYGGAGDIFVAKFDQDWNTLFSSYIGGARFEQTWGMALDKAGNAYLVGNTRSADFPIVNGLQKKLSGDRDAFLVKLNPTGTQILYSTYLGGRGIDWGYCIGIDAKGALYIAGGTGSPDFPVRNAAQARYQGGDDAFVTKLAPDGSAIVYSTYIGGGNTERIWGIQVDAKGRAYVAGETGSPNFPTVNAFQKRFGGGKIDAFMTAISEDGKRFVYSTFAGGTSTDQGLAVAVDAKGNARYVGSAGNKTFPLRQPIQANFGGGASDGFVLGVSRGGALQFSTFLGGALGDAAFAMEMDAQSNIYITGQTESANFPVRNALQPKLGGLRDGFLTKLRPDGKAYVYSTFFGGAAIDEGTTIDVVSSSLVYIGGYSDGGFPLVRPEQATYAGLRDGLITRVTDSPAALAVSCATAVKRLPRADERLIDVGLSAEATGGDGGVHELAVQVFGDDGAALDDVDSPEPGRLLLRAERSSAAGDRVYLIVVSARDGAGNLGSATCSVVVPRSQRPEEVESALARAAELENSFERQQALPAGFSRLHGTGPAIQ